MKEIADIDHRRSLGELLKASRQRLEAEKRLMRLDLIQARWLPEPERSAKLASLDNREMKIRLDDISLRDCEKALS